MGLGYYLFSFKGRINRAKQWIYVGTVLVITFGYMSIAKTYLGLSFRDFFFGLSRAGIDSSLGREVLLAMYPLWLLLIVPDMAMGIKRLHDRGKSAWWALLLIFLPQAWSIFGGAILSESAHNGNATEALVRKIGDVFLLVIELWAFVEIYCLRGTVGINRMGPTLSGYRSNRFSSELRKLLFNG